MKNIAIITSTRAEYGLLKPLIVSLRKHETKELGVALVVTGTHLSEAHGNTIAEIENDNIRIDEKIAVRVNAKTAEDIALNQADIIVKFTKLFIEKKYDAIVILGDRYEMQMIAIAATNTRTPIFHICGGDTTEGAIDESIRHSITKMSFCHFTTCDESRRRVIQLGENPDCVYNVGSTSIDNILGMPLLSEKEALESVGLVEGPYAIATYHPVTLEDQNIEDDIMAFIEAIKAYPTIQFIVTKANADKGGDIVNAILEREAAETDNMHVFASLGVKRYLSLMKNAQFVIGNSSSGIIETPAFHIPTVNIGDRQKGRLQSEGTVNCDATTEAIVAAIKQALSEETKKLAGRVVSPYGDGTAASQMTDIILDRIAGPIDLKKKFYDIK